MKKIIIIISAVVILLIGGFIFWNISMKNTDVDENKSVMVNISEEEATEKSRKVAQKYLDISWGESSGPHLPYEVLDIESMSEIEDREDQEALEAEHPEGFYKTKIKYADFESAYNKAINECMTPEYSKESGWSMIDNEWYVNFNGDLWILSTGATGVTEQITEFELQTIKDDEYLFKAKIEFYTIDLLDNIHTEYFTMKNIDGNLLLNDWKYGEDIRQFSDNSSIWEGFYKNDKTPLTLNIWNISDGHIKFLINATSASDFGTDGSIDQFDGIALIKDEVATFDYEGKKLTFRFGKSKDSIVFGDGWEIIDYDLAGEFIWNSDIDKAKLKF